MRTEFECKKCGHKFDTYFMATMDYCKKCIPSVINQLKAENADLHKEYQDIGNQLNKALDGNKLLKELLHLALQNIDPHTTIQQAAYDKIEQALKGE